MKNQFHVFLINNILEKTITEDVWLFLLNNTNYNFIWCYLLKKSLEKHFNFILTVQICFKLFDFDSEYSKIEQKVYKNLSQNEIYYSMIKTLEIILKDNFNEMIKNDLDIINRTDIWAAVNLDSLYFLNLDHINFEKLIKLKKNPKLYKKILQMNIIINTLERLNGLYFYTKLKSGSYPDDLIANINFTKGYLICFEPSLVTILKNYKYTRKLIKKSYTPIQFKKNINFIDSLKNSNFSEPIWLNDKNLNITDYNNTKIYNKKLINKKSKIKICVSNLNFLNSIELTYNKDLLKSLIAIIEKNTFIHSTLSSKSSLENIILKINSNDSNSFTEISSNLSTLIQSASTLELIKKQLQYYSSFFLDHRLDHRLRIYCYPWPINYQLNHIIRVILKFKKISNINKIWKNFWSHSLIKKYIKNYNIFEFNLNGYIDKELTNFLKNKNIFSESIEENNLKKEYIYQILLKISPKDIKSNEEKISFSLNILEKIITSDLEKDWEFWLNLLKKKKKKLPYVMGYLNSIKNIIKNDFSDIFWSDASSNAIQLIVLRLKLKNETLLKLINIKDNDTIYVNIYDYITEKIKEYPHSKILKMLSNKLTIDDINQLQDIDNNKYLLMPSAYGMGKHTYREKLDIMLSNDERSEIWNRLEISEKKKLSDYFWDLAEKILTEIDFDINQYKNICKNFYNNTDYSAFIWKNDLGITIAPIVIENSKRHAILKKLNILKLKKRETIDINKKELLLDQEKKLKKKLQNDDKNFWKRTMIKTKKNKIFARIFFRKNHKIDKRETRQSLIPNTIHAYDSSVMHLAIQICRKLEIEILTIHDSIGSSGLTLPLIKIIFKVANILILDINNKKQIFPINNGNRLSQKELENLFENIIKSKNFFS